MNEFKSGEVLELQGGLDIIGMLVFPDGTKSTIRTPFIFVQGKLSMKSTKVVNGDPDLRVVLYGTKDVIFNPHSIQTQTQLTQLSLSVLMRTSSAISAISCNKFWC